MSYYYSLNLNPKCGRGCRTSRKSLNRATRVTYRHDYLLGWVVLQPRAQVLSSTRLTIWICLAFIYEVESLCNPCRIKICIISCKLKPDFDFPRFLIGGSLGKDCLLIHHTFTRYTYTYQSTRTIAGPFHLQNHYRS